MNDVKKTWCGPVYTLDPEKMERQLDRLSAEGWQLEGTGWFSLRYRRGKPNEYCYRVQYLYESRDGQRDDYVRGLAELGVEPVMDIGSFLILRRRNDGTPFELFSDLDSRITSEKRYLRTRCALTAARLLLAGLCLYYAVDWYRLALAYNVDWMEKSGSGFPAILGGAHHRRRDSGIAVACHRDLCSPAGVPLREAAPQAAAGAAYRRIKEARLPRAAFLYAIFTG